MGLTENFLVNTTNFESILEKLRTVEELPEQVDKDYLEEIGYSNPSDLLVLHLLKELNMLDSENEPTPLIDKFRDNETSKEAMALGVVDAYSDLFTDNRYIYRNSIDELTEEFRKHFGSSKSDLILKYMANTFKTLVAYVGQKNIESIFKTHEPEEVSSSEVSNIESVIKEIAHRHKNGNHDLTEKNGAEVSVAESEENELEAEQPGHVGEEPDILNEEKGETEIDDFISASSEDIEEEDGGNEDDTADYDDSSSEVYEFSDSSEDVQEVEKESKKSDKKPEDIVDIKIISEEPNDNYEDSTPEKDPFGFEENEKSNDGTMETLNITEETNEKEEQTERQYIDKAFIKKAALLYKLEKYYDALSAFDEVFNRFAKSDDDEYYDQASNALIKKMEIMERLDLSDGLVPVYSKVIKRLGDSDNTDFVKQVDHAYVGQAEHLMESENPEEGLNAIIEAINRFKETDRESQFLEKAMFMKAELLEKSGKDEEALEAYEDFLGVFGDN